MVNMTFNLSEKIANPSITDEVIPAKDVAEFIRLLKEYANTFKGKDIPYNWVIGQIKFLAGEKFQ